MKRIMLMFAMVICTYSLFANGQADAENAQGKADINDDGTVNNPEAVVTDKDKLILWSLFSGGDGSYMDQILEDYNAANPDKQVQSIMLVWDDYYTKLMTAVAARKGPDIGISHISKLPELVDQGVVIAIDKYADKAGTDWDNYASLMNAGVTFNGKHYAMPLDTHAEIVYFNTDWLRKAGITLNQQGQVSVNGMPEFLSILGKLKNISGDNQTSLSLTQSGDDPYRFWWALYFQMGGTALINTAGNQVTMDKKIAENAAKTIKGLYDNGYILKGITDHQKFFQSGNAGMFVGGTWATGAFEQTQDLHFIGQPFPSLLGDEACWADAHTFVIPAKPSRSAEDTQAAVNFINWASSEGASTWAMSGQIPSSLEVQKSAAYLALPYRSGYMKAASTAVLPSKNPNFYSMKEAMIRNLDTIWTEQVSVDAGIDNMFEELQEAIQ